MTGLGQLLERDSLCVVLQAFSPVKYRAIVGKQSSRPRDDAVMKDRVRWPAGAVDKS